MALLPQGRDGEKSPSTPPLALYPPSWETVSHPLAIVGSSANQALCSLALACRVQARPGHRQAVRRR